MMIFEKIASDCSLLISVKFFQFSLNFFHYSLGGKVRCVQWCYKLKGIQQSSLFATWNLEEVEGSLSMLYAKRVCTFPQEKH